MRVNLGVFDFSDEDRENIALALDQLIEADADSMPWGGGWLEFMEGVQPINKKGLATRAGITAFIGSLITKTLHQLKVEGHVPEAWEKGGGPVMDLLFSGSAPLSGGERRDLDEHGNIPRLIQLAPLKAFHRDNEGSEIGRNALGMGEPSFLQERWEDIKDEITWIGGSDELESDVFLDAQYNDPDEDEPKAMVYVVTRDGLTGVALPVEQYHDGWGAADHGFDLLTGRRHRWSGPQLDMLWNSMVSG